eukprot:TRINITY_DN4859_c0_g1_i2.p2 TRINITY_DN4859_c0_g1~~TRINITY_DN4859_c0_g1_i2.p2  ORF type:complete len:358 (-),score=98.02 TRINITY_DN4859_c0_g1_i2:1120-2193(-)
MHAAADNAAAAVRQAAVVAAAETAEKTKTAAASKASGGRKAAGGRKAVRGGKDKAAVEADLVEIVDIEDDVATLKREAAELIKLKAQLADLTATVAHNTELLGTHGHAMDVLASSFTDLKLELRTACKPAPPAAPSDDKHDDTDQEEPPAPKRLRFAATKTVLAPSQTRLPTPPVPSKSRVAPPSTNDDVPPPAVEQVPPLEDLVPLQLARFEPAKHEMGPITTGPRSRLRRPSPRVCDMETPAEAQARRRAEGTVIMQGIRDLLLPRVTRLIAQVTVSRDVLLDPETKFETIVDNATEYMGVATDEANVFLLDMIDQPTKKHTRGSVQPRAVRACAPLGMVFAHVMWAIKAAVVAA